MCFMKVLCYSRCSTCRKALAWLDQNKIEYDLRDIVTENPKATEIKKWHKLSGLPLKKFFNTSGLKYKELNLKDKLPEMTESEMYKLLATDGKLVKRPLVVLEDKILLGFKEEEWKAALGKASK